MTNEERLALIKERLQKISALAGNPHWTADRRWTIQSYADQCLHLMWEIDRDRP
jgi:hypothetical protein